MGSYHRGEGPWIEFQPGVFAQEGASINDHRGVFTFMMLRRLNEETGEWEDTGVYGWWRFSKVGDKTLPPELRNREYVDTSCPYRKGWV